MPLLTAKYPALHEPEEFYIVTLDGRVLGGGTPVDLLRTDKDIQRSSTASTANAALAVTVATQVNLNPSMTAGFFLNRRVGKGLYFIFQVVWQITTAAAGAGTQGRMRIQYGRNFASEATPISQGVGQTRALTALATFRELIALPDPAGTTYLERKLFRHNPIGVPSDTVDSIWFRLQLDVTTASGTGGDTCAITVHHDPATAGNELMFQMFGRE